MLPLLPLLCSHLVFPSGCTLFSSPDEDHNALWWWYADIVSLTETVCVCVIWPADRYEIFLLFFSSIDKCVLSQFPFAISHSSFAKPSVPPLLIRRWAAVSANEMEEMVFHWSNRADSISIPSPPISVAIQSTSHCHWAPISAFKN